MGADARAEGARGRPIATIGPLLVLADATAVLAGVAAAGRLDDATAVLGTVLGALVLTSALHLYRPRLVLSALSDAPALVAVVVSTGLLLLGLIRAPSGSTGSTGSVGSVATAIALYAVVSGCALVVLRWLTYAVTTAGRRRGSLARPVIVVGAGAVGRHLARTLLTQRGIGLVPVGFLDDGDVDRRALPVPLLGRLRDLPQAMDDLDVQDVLFAFGDGEDDRFATLIHHVQRRRAQAFVVPRFFEIVGLEPSVRTEIVGHVPLQRLRRIRARPLTRASKRALDVVVSATSLLVLSPLLAVVALGVRLETGSGVLRRRRQVGRTGQVFDLLTFQILTRPRRDAATRWNIDGAQRVGPFGRLLRTSGLDELPQLWNVLRGDLSLTGGRLEASPVGARHSGDTGADGTDRPVPPTLAAGEPAEPPEPEPEPEPADPIGHTGPALPPSSPRAVTRIGVEGSDELEAIVETWSLWGDVQVRRQVSEGRELIDASETPSDPGRPA